jgi:hypothetical protein
MNEQTLYIVTGVLVNGRRFKPLRFPTPQWALCINLWAW